MSVDRTHAWGFTLFADDLRVEVGGKISLMGIYQNDLIVTADELPVVMSKLILMVKYYEIANQVSGDVKFVVNFPEHAGTKVPPLERVIRRAEFPKIAEELRSDEGDLPFVHLSIPFILSPFPIVAEGNIRVRCHFEDGSVLKLGRLNLIIRKPPEGVISKKKE